MLVHETLEENPDDYLTPVNLVTLPVRNHVVAKPKERCRPEHTSPVRLCSFEKRKEHFNLNECNMIQADSLKVRNEDLEKDRRRSIKPISFLKRFQSKLNGEIEIPVMNPLNGNVNKNVTIIYDQEDIDSIYDDECDSKQTNEPMSTNSAVEILHSKGNGQSQRKNEQQHPYTIDYYFKKTEIPKPDPVVKSLKRSLDAQAVIESADEMAVDKSCSKTAAKRKKEESTVPFQKRENFQLIHLRFVFQNLLLVSEKQSF